MNRFGRIARFTALVAVWALLLQAATPMLAAWAAQRQGVPVAEVCEVHGVAMPRAVTSDTASTATARNDDPSAPTSHGSRTGHCALLAVSAFAPPATAPLAPVPSELVLSPARPITTAAPCRDDCTRWMARLHHGPPASA